MTHMYTTTSTHISPPKKPTTQCTLLQQCAEGLQGPLGVPSLEAWVQEVLCILYVLTRRSRAVAAVLTMSLGLLTQLLTLCWQPICLSLGVWGIVGVWVWVWVGGCGCRLMMTMQQCVDAQEGTYMCLPCIFHTLMKHIANTYSILHIDETHSKHILHFTHR